jgi:Dolichyl-phosphate-mannose-protein mannosyltransferase
MQRSIRHPRLTRRTGDESQANQQLEVPLEEPVEQLAESSSALIRLHHALAQLDPSFLLILLGAGVLRFYNLFWDQGTHIHPDERFLTIVGTNAKLPHGILQYFDPQTSPLNPANTGNTFYVYGMLPVTLNKVLAVLLGNDNYDSFTIQGRFLSALADLVVVVLVYLTARLLIERYGLPRQIKYLAPFFYAIAVLPIQLGHFFAVDTFMNVFMFASFYFALRYSRQRSWLNLGLSGACFGFAIACKSSGIFILPLDLFFILSPLLHEPGTDTLKFRLRIPRLSDLDRGLLEKSLDALELLFGFALISYVFVRIGDPYLFQTSNVLDPSISHLFLSNLQQLQAENNPNSGVPPGVQWIHKLPVIFSLVNLAFFGFGLAAFLFVVVGCYLIATKPYRTELFIILSWILVFFLYQSTQYVKTMRYFIFIYPFLAIFAAVGFYALTRASRSFARPLLIVALLVWPLAFMSIYVHPLSRYQASQWMFRNLPNGAHLLNESWDDPLPLGGVQPTYGKTLAGDILPNVDPDTPGKWYQYDVDLARGDYLILSSNRGYGSMPTVPEKFPITTRFYRELLAGRPVTIPHYAKVANSTSYHYLGTETFWYKPLATFTSYPSLSYLGIPIDFPDDWSEEAFTVYDHPKVLIFEHVRRHP